MRGRQNPRRLDMRLVWASPSGKVEVREMRPSVFEVWTDLGGGWRVVSGGTNALSITHWAMGFEAGALAERREWHSREGWAS